MANRDYQGYTLVQLLKAAKPGTYVSREDCGKALGVNPGSVPVYLIGLRDWFGVEIAAHKNGRTVLGYELITRDIDVPQFGRRGTAAATKAAKPKTVKTPKTPKPQKAKAVVEKVAVVKKTAAPKRDVADVIDDMQVDEITDNELSDIRAQLGL